MRAALAIAAPSEVGVDDAWAAVEEVAPLRRYINRHLGWILFHLN